LISEKGFSIRGYFTQEYWHFPPFGEKASHSRTAPLSLHLFLQKNLITVTTAVTLAVFAVSIATSSALAISLGAVSTTLIGQGL
jgi:hypothetical protein